jgi:glycosyltransferase involved in cell wall biosynthesis
MNIAILLPYKENFTKKKAGAVSIFVNDTNKISNYRKNIIVYGYTSFKDIFKNYTNLHIRKKIFNSTSSQYLKKFLVETKNIKIDVLEIHNRPNYINFLDKYSMSKKILYFHNDPQNMLGSRTINERINLLNKTEVIVFNSNWSKTRFLENLPNHTSYKKIIVIPQSTSKTKISFDKKKNLISFVGKLNTSKGYDIFGRSILKILDKYVNWKSIVIGDEPREKLIFKHKNLKHLGYKNNSYILNKLKEVSISVVPSKWDEPFGRSSLEAASRGSALIISNSGGLSETTKDALVIENITVDNLYKKIKFLIDNKQYRKKLQKSAYKNFIFTNKYSSNLIDTLRSSILSKKININFNKNKKLKILYITNFNERFNGRLHYNTGKRIYNGLIKLGHNVFSISDRDIVSNYKSLVDPSGKNILNNKIIESCKNFNPDTIIMGHADSVKTETLDYLKNDNKNLKICQWFLDPITRYGPDYINNKNRLLKSEKFIDASFITTDPNSIDFNLNNSYFIPNPVDESFETLKNYEKNPKNDLFFAMSHGVHRGTLKKGKIDDREKLLNKLFNKNKKIKFDFYGYGNKQPVWGDNFINVLSNSKMGLNLSRGKPIKYYSSDRLAQLMGNGLLTFIDEKTCYSDFFTNNEIVTYKNYDDLVEKLYKYKKNDKERKLIAKNGKLKYLRYFNSTLVAEFIINKTYDIKKKYYWDNNN